MSSSLDIGGTTVEGRAWIAPMTGVSDLPFRRAASGQGAAYVATEMVACAEFAKGRPGVVRLAAAALMREPDLAAQLRAAGVEAVDVPVTVKMRLGWDDATKNAPEIAARA